MNPEKANNSEQNETSGWDSLKGVSFNPDLANKIILEQGNGETGENRDDRATFIQTPEGEKSRNAFLMIGKNENGIEFENGVYISIEDVENALSKSLAEEKDAKLISVMEGNKEIELAGAMKQIALTAAEGHSTIKLTEKDNNGRGGELRGMSVADVTGEYDANGMLILGGEQDIPNGEYFTEKAISDALAEYMIGTPKIGDTIIKPDEADKVIPPEKQNIARKKMAKKIAAIAGAAILAFTLIGSNAIGDNAVAEKQNPNSPKAEVVTEVNDGVNIGDTINMPEGVEYHESSDYDYGGANAQGEVGNQLEKGDYTVESYSVLDPDTHEVVADNVTWEDGTNLDNYLNKISEKTGDSVEELKDNTRIHIAENGSGSDAGWINYDNNEQILNNGGK